MGFGELKPTETDDYPLFESDDFLIMGGLFFVVETDLDLFLLIALFRITFIRIVYSL